MDDMTLTKFIQGAVFVFFLRVTKYALSEPERGSHIISMINQYSFIRGDNAHVLFSDLACENIDRVYAILSLVPENVLKDACNRQDYSGIDLIKPYLKFKEN